MNKAPKCAMRNCVHRQLLVTLTKWHRKEAAWAAALHSFIRAPVVVSK